MWTLTPDDIRCAKSELIQRRRATEVRHDEELKAMQSKHGEELKAIDDEFAQITAIEQAANDFTRKYKQRASVDKGDAQELATRLTTPTNLTATARNWGDARFTSAIAAQADRT